MTGKLKFKSLECFLQKWPWQWAERAERFWLSSYRLQWPLIDPIWRGSLNRVGLQMTEPGNFLKLSASTHRDRFAKEKNCIRPVSAPSHTCAWVASLPAVNAILGQGREVLRYHFRQRKKRKLRALEIKQKSKFKHLKLLLIKNKPRIS